MTSERFAAYTPHPARQISTGHLVNLTTTDVERFQYGGTFVNYLWGAPLESLVILYFGLDLVGVSFLAGFAALALMVPTQAVFSRKFSEVRQRVTVLTDERVKLTNQAVTGARLMKINAWEPALEKEIRRREAFVFLREASSCTTSDEGSACRDVCSVH